MPKKMRVARLVGTVAVAVVLGGQSGVVAHEADGHPARIQYGTCDNLSGVVFQLTGVGAALTPDGTPVPASTTVGTTTAPPLQLSETTLKTSLTQLTKDPYAIVVYESDEAMDHIIACGDVGGVLTSQMAGMIMPGDELAIWLTGPDNPGFSGVALLQADGMQAIVRVFLAEGSPGDAAHGPSAESDALATPASDSN